MGCVSGSSRDPSVNQGSGDGDWTHTKQGLFDVQTWRARKWIEDKRSGLKTMIRPIDAKSSGFSQTVTPRERRGGRHLAVGVCPTKELAAISFFEYQTVRVTATVITSRVGPLGSAGIIRPVF